MDHTAARNWPTGFKKETSVHYYINFTDENIKAQTSFFPKVTQVLILEAMSEPQVSLRGKKKKSRFFLAIAEHQSQILV